MQEVSVIICSVKPELLKQVSENIEKTITVEHEIIAIDNSQNIYGICQAYNIGAEKSKYDNLCFVHEDVLFKTNNWGKQICSILENKDIGLIGLAGNTVKAKSPSPWWTYNTKYRRANIKHVLNSKIEKLYYNPNNEELSEVVAIDGVFMCCRKEVWQKNKFDEINFPKFHSYDIDFSMQIYQNYKIFVTFEIELEHHSTGSYNSQWVESVINYAKKWNKKLPVSSQVLSKIEKKQIEKEALTIFISTLLSNKKRKLLFVKYLLKKIRISFWDKTNIIFLKRFVKNILN